MKRNILALLLCLMLVGSLTLSVSAGSEELPRIVDMADLLTDAEEAALEEAAESLRDTYDMDAVIVTVDSLEGKSAQAYADDYYDDHGYGVGADYSGVLLLIAMDTREWYISTCGEAIYSLSDYDLDRLFDAMSSYLSGGDYYSAFDAYLDALPGYLSGSTGGYDYDDDYGSSGYRDPVYHTGTADRFDFSHLLIALVIGVFAGAIGLLIMRSSMNTKRQQRSAGDYLLRDSYHLNVQRDRFLYSRVHKTPRPKDNGGSRGGGSVHRSSGGRSHGGRGGRF